MNEEKKNYLCKLPTNGHQPGDVVELTEDEVANFNAGEVEPRFILAGEVVADVAQAASDTGEYVEDEKEEEKEEEVKAPESGDSSTGSDTTPQKEEGVE
jgi:hypothetical protein